MERFTLALMLCVVAFRNLIELSGSEFDFREGFVLPKSFGWVWGNNILWTISYVRNLIAQLWDTTDLRQQPVLTVLVSEMLVDWLKHAFITKFNHIRPSVYERYTDVLCRDLASGSAVGRRGARKVFSSLQIAGRAHPVSTHTLTRLPWWPGGWALHPFL